MVRGFQLCRNFNTVAIFITWMSETGFLLHTFIANEHMHIALSRQYTMHMKRWCCRKRTEANLM